MSSSGGADVNGSCPRCTGLANQANLDSERAINDSYGRVPLSEFLELVERHIAKADEVAQAVRATTLWSSAKLDLQTEAGWKIRATVRFGADCSVCGWTQAETRDIIIQLKDNDNG